MTTATVPTVQATFKVGDHITAKPFTNCFGDPVPTIIGLVVTDVRLVESNSIAPYYRLDAVRRDDLIDSLGMARVEGAERFFVHA